jgi:RNA polymerase sigma factor (sigma-70 family)
MRRTGPVSLRSPHSPDDADLITLVRRGDLHAYGILYSRHVDSAYNLAGQLVRGSRSAQDNLVAAAFQTVLEALNAGGGPESTFRACLLATLREVALNVVSDAALITSVREGDLDVYGALYARHVASAYNLARQLCRSQAEADDLVSEAFAKVLDTLKAGGGPDSAFRAYLLTALRNTAYDKTRRDRKVELADDVSRVSGVSAEAVSVPFSDPAVAGLERSLAVRAFARLPERWQAVLWHTEILGQAPAEVAPILGLTPNGVSALAYRAREGLKQAYLQVYLADNPEQRCRATTDRLGAWTRDGLSKREKAQVESHLDECDPCMALAAELADVNSTLNRKAA